MTIWVRFYNRKAIKTRRNQNQPSNTKWDRFKRIASQHIYRSQALGARPARNERHRVPEERVGHRIRK